MGAQCAAGRRGARRAPRRGAILGRNRRLGFDGHSYLDTKPGVPRDVEYPVGAGQGAELRHAQAEVAPDEVRGKLRVVEGKDFLQVVSRDPRRYLAAAAHSRFTCLLTRTAFLYAGEMVVTNITNVAAPRHS
jgi:hypothetical protein